MNYNEKKFLLSKFPQVELCYEKKLHNKVRNIDYYITIPFGKKYFAWFKNYNNKNYLFILEIDKNKNKINSIVPTFGCFKNNLCFGKGTILYGTIFKYKNNNFFNIEDCLYYKNKDLSDFTNLDKLKKTRDLFNNIKQKSYNNNQIIFGLPNMTNKHSEINKIINDTPYKLYAIQHRFLTKNIDIFYNEQITNYNIFANFLIKPMIAPDTYKIIALKNHKLIEHSYLLISSYNKSVFMNKLFRNIKENENLDYIEESDDDEEFENISENKFILKKEYIFRCVLNRKLKLWEPVEIIKDKISNLNDILEIEKNN
mgnify:FL=1|uniref:mRNA capping enzyme adenylation domain-containing protein n=1 Tax=viral metagenome TaxID=1070528 RepID=A0A6C0F8R7_9ZZZZ|tara:strand:- start:19509 stop:20447 length:939 start_codon:yes stop_codon:yes gene_type:complete